MFSSKKCTQVIEVLIDRDSRTEGTEFKSSLFADLKEEKSEVFAHLQRLWILLTFA